jgi:hypothetical protein
MSYDNVYFAAAGFRNHPGYSGMPYEDGLTRPGGTAAGKFEVRLNHGLVERKDRTCTLVLIDDLFIFETLEDAEWFHTGGFRKKLFVGEAEPDWMSPVRAHETKVIPSHDRVHVLALLDEGLNGVGKQHYSKRGDFTYGIPEGMTAQDAIKPILTQSVGEPFIYELSFGGHRTYIKSGEVIESPFEAAETNGGCN